MEAKSVERIAAIFLQVVIVVLGVVIFAALLYEPIIEGVNANATSLYDIYVDDPFLAYAYASSSAFFIALYQAFIVAGNIGRSEWRSIRSKRALHVIKYCGSLSLPSLLRRSSTLSVCVQETILQAGSLLGSSSFSSRSLRQLPQHCWRRI